MNLVFVGAEVAPWSKTGGLGDGPGGLPPAMAANGNRVMMDSSCYNQYKDVWNTTVSVEIKVGDKIETVQFFHCYKRGVDRVFVDQPIFLEKVALEAPRALSLSSNKYFSGPYGDDVVFIANDWQTTILPYNIKSINKFKRIYESAKICLYKALSSSWESTHASEALRIFMV
ncbi:hypothetical protein GIB67_025802 [Kingdonia uniflora]|uniref:Starch synthase catalytic domain-containing protein n=1 Tax=Kingdonia uniflora TaxID=39325 RepID=A0A7J7NSP3_9MAGN|nr:hypothetical protein GIB67_025802 [Kingdonia uniflora]